MNILSVDAPITIIVGSGGVGKTTVAAALGLRSAAGGADTLVMTFDPSLRLKDTLGVTDTPEHDEARVHSSTKGRLVASLLNARRVFDRLIATYAPDDAAAQRILGNRFYDNLSGTLAGVLEYMAVERLYEVVTANKYQRIILDTPPTRQALDFLEAPQRLVSFLSSGALRIALKPWFDEQGHLRPTSRFGFVGRSVESLLDRVVGLELLRDMAEFFQCFAPLYDGFAERALEVQELLRSPRCNFVLISGPGSLRIADTMYFARSLTQAGHRLAAVVVNRVHPQASDDVEEWTTPDATDGRQLLAWLGRHDAHAEHELRQLLPKHCLVSLPLLEREPTDLSSLDDLGKLLQQRLAAFEACRELGG